MGRVLVELAGATGEELAALVLDALAARSTEAGSLPDGTTLESLRVQAQPDPPPRTPTPGSPSARYGDAQRQKLASGRWEAVTPQDVVAWWASRYLAAFGAEDAALQAVGAIGKHETLVRSALRRYFAGDQRDLLRYLTALLRWWRLRRDREDRRANGFPRLQQALSADWLIGLYRSGDMVREVEASR